MIDTLTNIILSVFFGLIDLYLINFYLRHVSKQTSIKFNIFSFIIKIITLSIINSYRKPTLTSYLLLILLILLIFYNYQKNYIQILKTLFIFVFIFPLIDILTIAILEYILDCTLSTNFNHFATMYALLIKFIQSYLKLILSSYFIKYQTKEKIQLRYFKSISIFLSLYLSFTLLLQLNYFLYFENIGRSFLFMTIIYNTVLIAFDRYQRNEEKLKVKTALEKQMITQTQHELKKTQEKMLEIRKIKHNVKSNYIILQGYLQQDDVDSALEHLEVLVGQLKNVGFNQHFNSIAIDSIFEAKIADMNIHKIEYKENIQGLFLGNIKDEDLALLISLAFDNAIEACKDIIEKRFIHFNAKTQNHHLIIHIKNSIKPGLKPTFTHTSKTSNIENHGFGVKHIQEIVKKYDGQSDYFYTENEVNLRIILKT